MDTNDLPDHHLVQDSLDALRLGIDAGGLHGSLCGFLCAGHPLGGDWLRQLALDPVDTAAAAADTTLAGLLDASRTQLDDPALGFALLLPEEPLEARAEALLDWCRGFLGGFGLGAGRALSEEGEEALDDLGRIAATSLSFEDPQSDAESLEELVEFVRVAVLLLHGDSHRPAHAALH